MLEKDTVVIISEDDKTYTALVNGVETKYTKIDLEEIKLNHTADLYKAAAYLSKRNVDEALFLTNKILEKPPSVVDYEDISKVVVGLLNRFHFDLKPQGLTRLVHSLIKNIDTNTYGKAQTFICNIDLWNKDIKVIHDFMDEMVGF